MGSQPQNFALRLNDFHGSERIESVQSMQSKMFQQSYNTSSYNSREEQEDITGVSSATNGQS